MWYLKPFLYTSIDDMLKTDLTMLILKAFTAKVITKYLKHAVKPIQKYRNVYTGHVS